jgi:hypothetical protein
MKIGREQRRAFGEGLTARRMPWLRLSLSMIVGWLGTVGCVFTENAFAQAADLSPTIRVRVYNYVKASPPMLARVEREAGRILGEAGLRMVWLDCPMEHFGGVHIEQNPCLEPLEATDIVLRVLSEATQNKFQDTVFGFAVVPIFATVYYDYAVRAGKRDNAEFEVPVILGCVIAHELGHLLLGSNSHSNSGVMQPRWERKQVRQAMTNTLLFTPEQSKLIQAEGQKRIKLQTASLKKQHMRTAD